MTRIQSIALPVHNTAAAAAAAAAAGGGGGGDLIGKIEVTAIQTLRKL